jgi:hypothetical protein
VLSPHPGAGSQHSENGESIAISEVSQRAWHQEEGQEIRDDKTSEGPEAPNLSCGAADGVRNLLCCKFEHGRIAYPHP